MLETHLNPSPDLQELAQQLVGMANSTGGILSLDVQNTSLEDVVERIQEASLLSTPVLILPKPRLTPHGTIEIVVPRGMMHVYAIDGRYLVRDGDFNRPLTTSELRHLLVMRGDLSYEEELPLDATIDDVDWAQVENYAATIATRRESAQDVLLRRGCLVKRQGQWLPTNAGILLFGREPQRFVRGARITAARFAGHKIGDVFTRQDIGGTLPEQIRRAETFLHDNLRKDVQLRASMERKEKFEYPMEAVRELVVNAVAHRDYSIQGDDIRLFIFADHMEVTSAGRLPGPVTVDNIVEERFSRNPAIVQVLADMGFIERLGYGVDRVIALMKSNTLPAPEFTETAGGFRVHLYNSPTSLARLSTFNVANVSVGKVAKVHLNSRQEMAINFLLQEGNTRITNKDLQELFPDVHTETIRRDFADLVSKRLLIKLGQKRGSYYVLAD